MGKKVEIDSLLSKKYAGLGTFDLDIGGIFVQSSKPELEAFKKIKQEEIRSKIVSLDAVKEIPVIRAYRDFYWEVGIDPTKTRPAGEALLRRILGGKDLPAVNTLVDSYNLASAETMISVAAFDAERVHRDRLLMRIADQGEKFLGIGMQTPVVLTGVEVVIEDTSRRELVAIYPYRDADASKVTERTSEVIFMMCGVPGISRDMLVAAGEMVSNYATRFCSNSSE